MVWRNAREELYSAVARNNSGVLTPPDAAVVVKREPPASPQGSGEIAPRNAPPQASGGNTPRNAPPQASGGNAPRNAPPQGSGGNAPRNAQHPPADPIRALLADRDALILIALILLLLHEKADIKLIGALAFVLLA